MEIIETILQWRSMVAVPGFEKDELKAVTWVRLHELARMEDDRPRTRSILMLELKRAIVRFIKRERKHAKRFVELFPAETGEDGIDEIDGIANPKIPMQHN